MGYDLNLAQRIRDHLSSISDLEEKRMFGGVAFLIRGNMACGVHGNDLILRVGAEKYGVALHRPFTRPFDIFGRPMAGWIMVAPPGCEQEHDLQDWIKKGFDFACSLPAK